MVFFEKKYKEMESLAETYYRAGNYEEAAKLLRKLANKEHAGAQRMLGFMYEKGEGVEQSNINALYWYRKAADNGDELASTKLFLLSNKGMASEGDATYFEQILEGNDELVVALKELADLLNDIPKDELEEIAEEVAEEVKRQLSLESQQPKGHGSK